MTGPVRPLPGPPTGPTVFPATAPLVPITEVESDVMPFTLPSTDPAFPYVDPALLGDGEHIEVTPANCGLGEDRIARVLWLSGLLGQALRALTPAERAELDREYAWPARALRADAGSSPAMVRR